MLVDNPLLTLLGRRGRGAVIEALLRNPARTWRLRELAKFADVAPMVASRATRELAALGAVEQLRPGRAARIRWRPASQAARFLAGAFPDLRSACAAAFAAAYQGPVGARALVLWREQTDDAADPLAPVRIAILATRNEDQAIEAVGPALDAVRRAGLPGPDVAVFPQRLVDGSDPAAIAIRAGTPLRTEAEASGGSPSALSRSRPHRTSRSGSLP